jgi:hypothetical protein
VLANRTQLAREAQPQGRLRRRRAHAHGGGGSALISLCLLCGLAGRCALGSRPRRSDTASVRRLRASTATAGVEIAISCGWLLVLDSKSQTETCFGKVTAAAG